MSDLWYYAEGDTTNGPFGSAPEWQAAMEAPILVATHGGPTMFARIGVMQALNRHHVREFDLDRKPHHWGKQKLKRDQ